MGYAEEPLPDPKNFLKKNQTTIREPKGRHFLGFPSNSIGANIVVDLSTVKSAPINRGEQPRKPAVPRANEAPKMAMKTEKNFIQSNALDAVMAVPKKPQRNIVDDRFGDKFPVDPSGLAPKYVMKKVGRSIAFARPETGHSSLRISGKCLSTSKLGRRIWKRRKKSINRTSRSTFDAEPCVKWMNRNDRRFSMVMNE